MYTRQYAVHTVQYTLSRTLELHLKHKHRLFNDQLCQLTSFPPTKLCSLNSTLHILTKCQHFPPHRHKWSVYWQVYHRFCHIRVHFCSLLKGEIYMFPDGQWHFASTKLIGISDAMNKSILFGDGFTESW